MRTAGVGILTCVLALAGCSAPRQEPAARRAVTVAAASDLKFALSDVLAAFHERHPDVAVRVTYGSSGNFFAQLSNHAPFDLYLSADMDYPRKLIDAGLAAPDSAFLYAVGHLVVWVPKRSALDVELLGLQALLDPSVRKIAMANPKFAPYGRAAEAALKKAGLYDEVQDRLVLGDNIAQTAQFVQSGGDDVGLLALSLASPPTFKAEGRYAEVPADLHPRLEQGGVILAWAKDEEAANLLRTFLAVQATEYAAPGQTALALLSFSFAALAVVYSLQRRVWVL